MEAGSRRLFIHLSILFNLCITHCYLPDAFMQSTIVPLVKCKGGDINDTNNYRAIALSNSLSKVLETLFLSKVNSTDLCDKYQFGFKAGHSQGSHVFICFVDFSKAFDKVNYWKLFQKLLDDNVNFSVVALLAFWYSN